MTHIVYVHVIMSKNYEFGSKNGLGSDLTEDESIKSALEGITVESIEKWIQRDVGVCITFLQAVHNDVNCRRALAEYLFGQHSNRVAHNAGVGGINGKL